MCCDSLHFRPPSVISLSTLLAAKNKLAMPPPKHTHTHIYFDIICTFFKRFQAILDGFKRFISISGCNSLHNVLNYPGFKFDCRSHFYSVIFLMGFFSVLLVFCFIPLLIFVNTQLSQARLIALPRASNFNLIKCNENTFAESTSHSEIA